MPKFYRFEKNGYCVDIYESSKRFYKSDSFPLVVANEFLPLTGGDSLRIWTQSIFIKYWEDCKNARLEMTRDGWTLYGSGNEKPLEARRGGGRAKR